MSKAIVYFRCGKHINKNPDKVRPSSPCPECMVSEKQASAKIAGRMSRLLGKKRSKKQKGN